MSKQNPEGFNVIRVPYWATEKLGTLSTEALRPPPEPVDPSFKGPLQMTRESLEREVAANGWDSNLAKMLRQTLRDLTNPESVYDRFMSAPIENRRNS